MENQGVAAGTCGIVTAVLVVVYLFLSISSLEPTVYGIDFSRITYQLGETKKGGRHWLGIGHSFIEFPAVVRRIEFQNQGSEFKKGDTLRSRTFDGLEVKLELSLQYRFDEQNVQEVYKKFGLRYEEVYVQMVIETITRAATNFSSTQFFSERGNIGSYFEKELADTFRNEALAEVSTVRLLEVELPTPFQDAIQATEVARQDVVKADQERATREVEGQTLVAKAEQEQKAIRIRGQTDARTTELQNQANVEQFNVTQRAQADSYTGVFNKLGATDADKEENLLEYLRMRAMRDHNPANSIINMAGSKAPAPGQEL